MILKYKEQLKSHLRWASLSVLVGILAGLSAAIFLYTLNWATKTRNAHPHIIWVLPFAGFLSGWIYHCYGKDANRGTNLVLDQIHDPQRTIPLRMAPLVLGGTVLTHLFGGSAGREGTAVQMGASLADQLPAYFRILREERKILLAAGAGAGFAAAIGAPWAGFLFGMEVIQVGRLKLTAWYQCGIAAFVAYFLTRAVGAPHSHYPQILVPGPHLKIFFFVAAAGILFGLAAKLFITLTHLIERAQERFVAYPPLRPFFGGLLLVVFFYLEGSYHYVGLGIPFIQTALTFPAQFLSPLYKAGFSALTIGSGFKGGEFIPLVFIGTTLGSALGSILPIAFSLLAALGFAAVFGGAANTPIACTIMAMEVFGYRIGAYALLACFMSYYFSGHSGIYSAQKVERRKHHHWISGVKWLGNLPKRFRG